MKRTSIIFTLLFVMTILLSCNETAKAPEQITRSKVAQKQETKDVIKGIRLYTLGSVPEKMKQNIMDSLSKHYPDCKFAGNLPLPKSAKTKKLNDHPRYRTGLLNEYLQKYKTDSTIIIGLTKADIGKDSFRGRPHYGIFGEANRRGGGVAVFSDYRCGKNLFRVITHEFGHAVGLRHCKNKECLMQDQEGKNKIKNTPSFCPDCKAYMNKQHWQ